MFKEIYLDNELKRLKRMIYESSNWKRSQTRGKHNREYWVPVVKKTN
jgi:hypothetical protein